MTFKLDRIEWAKLLDEEAAFERPPASEVLQRVDLNWGIWQRDSDPTTRVSF